MPVESRTHGARAPRPDENEEEGQEQQEAALLIEPIDPFAVPARASPSTANVTLQALRLRWGWLSASAMIVVASLFLLVKLPSLVIKPSQNMVQYDPSADMVGGQPSALSTGHGDLEGVSNKDRLVLMRLKKARQVAHEAAEALFADYGEDADTLFASVHYLNRDVIQKKLAKAIVGSILVGSLGDGGRQPGANPFVIGFAGTSVTAGHDNFFNQSYPLVFGRELNESFSAAGINLEVRNHAMGNNPAIPPCFCVGSQLGSDIDVAVWEFGMMVGGPSGLPSVETWIRNALSLPKQPAIMVLDPGEGARKPDGEGKIPTEPNVGTPGDYSRGFVQRETGRDMLRHYEKFGIHTQAMFEAVQQLDTKERYNFYKLVNQDKASPRGASWHPGPHGHALRGRILAYHYLRLLHDALSDVYFAVTNAQVLSLLEIERHELPPPLSCTPELCGHPTKCALTYQPRAESYLLDYVTEPKKVAKGLTEVNADNSRWHVQLVETDQGPVAFARDHGFGYLDLKYTLQATKPAGPLSFQVDSGSEGRIILCQPPGVWGKLPEGAGYLNTDAELLVNGQPMPLATAEWVSAQHAESPTCFFSSDTYPAGRHVITVRPTSDDKYVMVSAVVWAA